MTHYNHKFRGKIYHFLCAIFTTYLLVSCAADTGKKPNPNSSSNSNGASVNTPTATNSDQLCVNLSKSAFASSAMFGAFYQELCSSGALAELRGSPALKNTAAQAGSTSSLHLKALVTSDASTAKSYFNMVRLQITRPNDFSQVGFKYDSTLRYTPKSVGGSQGTNIDPTKYNMVSTREDLIVDYDATAYFLVAVPDQTYVVSTGLDEAHSVIKTFKGVQVINAKAGGGVEVFFFSDQTFDNQNNHAGTVQKALASFSEELARTKSNADNSKMADKFFQ